MTRKGLKQMLIERGRWRSGMVHEQIVAELRKDADFSPRSDHARAKVTELMAARGHATSFEVKYYAFGVHRAEVDAPPDLPWAMASLSSSLSRPCHGPTAGEPDSITE